MRVVLLSTAAGMRPGAIVVARDQLGVGGDDELVLVSLFRPRSPVPASRHLVVGPRGAQDVAVAPVTSVVPVAGAAGPAGAAPAGSEPLVPADAGPSVPVPARPAPAPSPAPAPPAASVRSPRARVRAFLRRARRSRWAGRVTASRRVRAAYTSALQNYRSWRFVLGTTRSPQVRRLVDDAGLVVSADVPANRAAWFLARRHRGPHVVVGYAAGRRILEAHEG